MDVSQFVLLGVLGLSVGAIYAGVGLGAVVTFKATGIINFAQAGFGVWAVFCYISLTSTGRFVVPAPGLPDISLGDGVPVVPAALISIATASALGALTYLLVFRRLHHSPAIARVVASVGVLVVVQALVSLKFGSTAQVARTPLPTGTLRLAGAVVPLERIWSALAALAVAAVVGLFLRHTRVGLAMRACADSEVNVAFAQWSPHMLALAAWSLGAGVTGAVMVLSAPAVGISPAGFGLLIVPGLAASLAGRLSSLGVTTVAGLGLGVLEAETAFLRGQDWWPSWASTGVAQLVPFLAIVLVLFVFGAKLPQRGELRLVRLPAVRLSQTSWVGSILPIVAGGLALSFTSGGYRFGLLTSFGLSIILLSVVVLTGLLGQISLGQAAVAGVGGFAMAKLAGSVPFPIDFLLAGGLAAAAGVLVGLPALRIRGAQLAVVSLAGAVALESFVFRNPSFAQPGGEPIASSTLLGIDLAARRGSDVARLPFGVFLLIVLVGASLAVRNLARGSVGRRFLAVRSDESAAAAAGVAVARTKLLGTAIASFLAGIGGATLGMTRGQLSADSFSVFVGLSLLAFAYIGGITSVSGAIVGGLLGPLGLIYAVAGRQFDVGRWHQLTAGVLLIVLVLVQPEGVSSSVGHLRDRVNARLRRRPRGRIAASVNPEPSELREGSLLGRFKPGRLVADSISVRYGGVLAVDGVDLRIDPGQIVGLIGPNGAGKTSLLDALCGLAPYSGCVQLEGHRLDGRSPDQRHGLGLSRTWQASHLFADLTVIENLAVAAHRPRWLDAGREMIRPRAPHRRRLLDVLESLDIAELADRLPHELSAGDAKVVDLARALASSPSVLLADEPTSGLDTTESRALGRKLRTLADSGLGILVVEHDLALVREVCDVLVVLDLGRILLAGEPEAVLSDASVADAYLGGTPVPSGLAG